MGNRTIRKRILFKIKWFLIGFQKGVIMKKVLHEIEEEMHEQMRIKDDLAER